MADHEAVLNGAMTRLQTDGSRREFLRLAALLGGTLAFAAACSDDGTVSGPGANLTLNFAQPVDVLKYAFALEALEADFYMKVAGNASFTTTFSSTSEREILTDVRDHEIAHREFFRAAITAAGGTVPTLNVTYPSTLSFTDRSALLTAAKTFEDLGVSAYNGAARYLVSRTDLLTIAGKIVSVEARHASAIRDLISPSTDQFANVSGITGADETHGLDGKATPQQVLTAASTYIVQTISVTGT